MAVSQIFGELFEFLERVPRRLAATHKAMLHVIVDQLALGIADSAFDGVELLREIKAGSALLEHRQHGGQMAVCSLEPGNDFRMRGVDIHVPSYPPGEDKGKGKRQAGIRESAYRLAAISPGFR
jgi:hypothetical protein